MLLTAYTREDQPGGLALLRKYGFIQVMRSPMSRLDVAAFDATRFAATEEKVRRAGITIHRMSDLKSRDPDWKRHWYDLELAINADHPMPDRGEPLPFETFAGFLDSPLVNTDAAFFALDPTGTYVGQSTLEVPDAHSTTLSVGMTGVLRSHRRMGIATALKIRTIEFAKAYGAQQIQTSNEENNPMFQLNLALGFQPAPAWLNFEKQQNELT
jgi:GNAT superfamily N-acetyltransferase